MKKTQERTYKVINDVITMPSELNSIALEKSQEGYNVKRGALGVVIITFDDGEVHYVPAKESIKVVMFEREGVIV